jgi:hypothetical protein
MGMGSAVLIYGGNTTTFTFLPTAISVDIYFFPICEILAFYCTVFSAKFARLIYAV